MSYNKNNRPDDAIRKALGIEEKTHNYLELQKPVKTPITIKKSKELILDEHLCGHVTGYPHQCKNDILRAMQDYADQETQVLQNQKYYIQKEYDELYDKAVKAGIIQSAIIIDPSKNA